MREEQTHGQHASQIGVGVDVRRTQRDIFKNVKLSSFLTFTETVTDYATFYHVVMSNIENVLNRAISEVKPGSNSIGDNS